MTGEKEKKQIPSKDLTAFLSLSKLNLVHCPTLTLPISKDGRYENLISKTSTNETCPLPNKNIKTKILFTAVHNWAKKYDLCGGVNAPIKISCVCSNGISYDQLLKGKDDLRQDAVMQQVFTIMNNMLRSNKETRKRKLHIRTYKIIPLSQRSGILEWCGNTTTLSDYLTSTNPRKLGAHQRYFPNDLPPQKCRSVISVSVWEISFTSSSSSCPFLMPRATKQETYARNCPNSVRSAINFIPYSIIISSKNSFALECGSNVDWLIQIVLPPHQ